MAVEEKIVYKVETEGAAKAASDFQRVTDELSRLSQVMGERPKEFAQEYAKSVNWLNDAMFDATVAGKKFGKEYTNLIPILNKFNGEAKRLAAGTEDVATETRKAGGTFSFAWGKAVKFFGAIGLGIYSMYTFANAIRRGVGAIKDWVTEGISRAIEENTTLSQLIKTQVVGAFDRLQLKLGQQVTPGITELASATSKLIGVLDETGTIEAFGRLLGNMITGAARGLAALAEGAERLQGIVDKIKEKLPEGEPDWRRITKGVKAAVPGAAGALAPFGLGWVPGAAAAPFLAAEWVASVGEVPEEESYWGKGGARQPKKEKPKRGPKPKGQTYDMYARPKGGWGKPQTPEEYEELVAAPRIGRERRELGGEIKGLAKSHQKRLAEIHGKIQAEAAKKAAKNRQVIMAHGEMMAQGLVAAAMSGDVKAAMSSLFQSVLSEIIGFATSSLLGTIFPPKGFQHEGLVTRPTFAMVGERGPEFIISQERMQGLLRGGRPGYEFGPEDFNVQAPDVNVAAPVVHVHVEADANVNVRTAYNARAGEVELSGLES